jgi:phenylpyruvate tautomerase PptA (4-oxalocrotonate tautomerase family)
MNAPNFFAGVAIIIVGALLFFAGPQLVMLPSTQTQVAGLFHDETFVVGDLWERSVQLEEGALVNGTVAVSSALTGEPSEVLMLVMDDAEYQNWVAQGSPTYVFQKDVSNRESFSFTVPRSGVYHFIFDNTSSPVKKKVTIAADLQKQVAVSLPDERVRYVAYGLLAIGVLVTAVGIVRKTQVPWA